MPAAITNFSISVEKAECAADKVDFTRHHVILEKLDGSMITPFRTADGEVRIGTKMGETDVARPAKEFANNNPAYITFANDMIDSGFTPIFEWCSRKQRIVIDYPEDRLVLTAVRDNVHGQYMPYAELVRLAEKYELDVVKALDGKVNNIHEFITMVRELKNLEGFVIRFDDGHMIKVKADEYVKIHRAKELFSFEKDIWTIILDEQLDDFLPLLEQEDQDRLSEFASKLNSAILAKANELKAKVDAWIRANGPDQKSFAVEFVNNNEVGIAANERSLMFMIKAGKNAVDVVRKYVRSQCNTATNIDGVRSMVAELKWGRYTNVNSD
ncbi:MAG: hypothetical protein HC836_33135 [Richelia sp. RM2_1_2]|nr:hypothetical protein [Richelia sp. RM2_1_2]